MSQETIKTDQRSPFHFLTHRLSSKPQKIIESIILALLILVIYLFTTNSDTRVYALPFLLFGFLFVGGVYLFQIRFTKSQQVMVQTRTFKILIFAFVGAILLWVGNTGWFLSPFFYLLYLVAISLGFLFSNSVTLSFVLVLIAILLPQMGTVNTKIDFISIVSLLLIIPLTYFLRREYLVRVEKDKKILILEKGHKAIETKVEEILANRVTKLGAELREPINDIRQLALYAKKNKEYNRKEFEAIISSSEKALSQLKSFEENTTGRILVKTPAKKTS